jgi:hypothetical protein
MTSSTQPPDLRATLAERGFAPNPVNPAWLELDTGQQVVRVRPDPEESALLHCLDQRGWCLYEAVFSPGTPDAVITAAIEAALSRPGPASPGPGQEPARRRTRTRKR